MPSVRTEEKIPLKKSILWIFEDLPVIRPNQIAREMTCSIEILVEHFCGSFSHRLRDRSVWLKIGNKCLNLTNSLELLHE